MADVFVSYAREDEARVAALVRLLEGHGLGVFWDRQIPPGRTWRDHIGRALTEARCVVVAWSASSVASDFVAEEADDARQRGVLVPVLIDDVLPPLGFRSVQAADLCGLGSGKVPRGTDEFLRAVDAVFGRTPVAVPTPAPAPHAAPAAPAPPPAAPSPAEAPFPPTRTPTAVASRRARGWPFVLAAAIVVLAAVAAWLVMRGAPTPPRAEVAGQVSDGRRPAAPPALRIVDAWRTDDGAMQVRVQVVHRGPQAVTFEAQRACALVGPDHPPQRASDSRPLFETLQPGEPTTLELRFDAAEGARSLRCRLPGGEAGEVALPALR